MNTLQLPTKCMNLMCPNKAGEGTLYLVKFMPATPKKPMTGRGHREVHFILCLGCITTIEDDTETQAIGDVDKF